MLQADTIVVVDVEKTLQLGVYHAIPLIY